MSFQAFCIMCLKQGWGGNGFRVSVLTYKILVDMAKVEGSYTRLATAATRAWGRKTELLLLWLKTETGYLK